MVCLECMFLNKKIFQHNSLKKIFHKMSDLHQLNEKFKSMETELKYINRLSIIKPSIAKIQRFDHHFTGDIIFGKTPKITNSKIDLNDNSSIITKKYSDDTKISKILQITNAINNSNVFSINLEAFCYKINNAEDNFILDFNECVFLENRSYIFTLIIMGIIFPSYCVNINETTIPISNIKSGSGSDIVRMTLIIDTDENLNFMIYANSFLYDTNKTDSRDAAYFNNIEIESTADTTTAFTLKSAAKTMSFINFTDFSPSEDDDINNCLCTGNNKIANLDASTLFLKCDVDGTVAGNNILDKYYMPMYKLQNA